MLVPERAYALRGTLIRRANGHRINNTLDRWLGEIHRRRFLQILFDQDDAADIDRYVLQAINDWIDNGEDAISDAYAIVLEDISIENSSTEEDAASAKPHESNPVSDKEEGEIGMYSHCEACGDVRPHVWRDENDPSCVTCMACGNKKYIDSED